MTWRGSRSSSSITGNTAAPRAASAGRAPFWTRPRPTVTWPRPGGYPAEDIVLFGRSLGTALATDLAIQKPCRALILESAFTNSSDMAKMLAPFLFDWRPKVPYDNLGKIDSS